MRQWLFIFAIGLVAGSLLTAIVTAAMAKVAGRAAILPDEKAGIVRVMIDGREIARFDKDGLFVDGRVGTTGAFLPPTVAGEPAPATEGGAP